MDESSHTNQLVWLELPDANQELFSQSLHDLNAFTCFPKLPREIRDLVWKGTFPGRRMIDLDIGPINNNHHRRRKDPALPAALHINKESRTITLRHYDLIYQTHPLITGERPLCINHTRDILYFSFGMHTIFNLSRLYAGNSSFFSKVKVLEIRNFTGLAQRSMEISIQRQGGDGGILKFFEGLEEVHLVATKIRDPSGSGLRDAWVMGGRSGRPDAYNIQLMIMKWFWGQRKPGVEWKGKGLRLWEDVPAVFFHWWRRVRARDDKELVYEGEYLGHEDRYLVELGEKLKEERERKQKRK